MKLEHMTRKTKEVHAEFMMKLSTSLVTSAIVAILIAPMIMIIRSSIVVGTSDLDSVECTTSALAGWKGITFLVLEGIVFIVAIYLQAQAYKIYNDLYPDNA